MKDSQGGAMACSSMFKHYGKKQRKGELLPLWSRFTAIYISDVASWYCFLFSSIPPQQSFTSFPCMVLWFFSPPFFMGGFPVVSMNDGTTPTDFSFLIWDFLGGHGLDFWSQLMREIKKSTTIDLVIWKGISICTSIKNQYKLTGGAILSCVRDWNQEIDDGVRTCVIARLYLVTCRSLWYIPPIY